MVKGPIIASGGCLDAVIGLGGPFVRESVRNESKNDIIGTVADLLPDRVSAQVHRKMAEPGSAKPASR